MSSKEKSSSLGNLTHNTIRLPNSLLDELEKYVGTKGFTSKAEVLKQAAREYMDRNPLPVEKPKTRFERINADSTGIKILDRKLDGGYLVHVTFSPQGVICDYHETDTCEHVEYALQQTDVQELLKEKKKDGWKIPDT